MNKSIRLMQNYLLYALPFVLICMVWGTVKSEQEILVNASFLTKAAWEMLSWNLIGWFAVLILFLLVVVLVPGVRDKTLKRLANLKERDEREQFITGNAARTAYISTLSLTIFLLFLSIFSFKIYRVSEEEAINGKAGMASIELGFELLDNSPSENNIIFESKNIALSKSALILGLIIWQLVAFSVSARRTSKGVS